MAWNFNEVDQYVSVADHAALTFPDGDWTVAGWVKLDDTTGNGWQYIISWGLHGADPSWNWYIGEEDAPSTNPYSLRFQIDDAAGDFKSYYTTGNVFNTTNWVHCVLRRSSGTFTMFVDGSENATHHSSSGTVNDINVAGALEFGRRSDDHPDRYLGGSLAEFGKWDRALTDEELAALAKGFAPTFFRHNLAWYVPMIRPYHEHVAGLSLTNNSSTVVDHPNIIYPFSPTVTWNGFDLVKIQNETLQASEGTARAQELRQILNETLNLPEGTAQAKVMALVLNETLNTVEGVLSVLGLVRVVDEVLNVSESLIRVRGLVQELNEVLQLVEGTSTAQSLTRIEDESLELLEGLDWARAQVRVLNDTLSTLEATDYTVAQTRTVNESLQVTEGLETVRGLVQIIDETLSLLEALAPVLGQKDPTLLLGVVDLIEKLQGQVDLIEKLAGDLSLDG